MFGFGLSVHPILNKQQMFSMTLDVGHKVTVTSRLTVTPEEFHDV